MLGQNVAREVFLFHTFLSLMPAHYFLSSSICMYVCMYIGLFVGLMKQIDEQAEEEGVPNTPFFKAGLAGYAIGLMLTFAGNILRYACVYVCCCLHNYLPYLPTYLDYH